ncbi:MAG: ABC transporter substrate-binding protein [Candidatus ainarchaeum sp.]|nr:ABC transporter substrate-binding protein [Candidatus ainarchaeum sp.]
MIKLYISISLVLLILLSGCVGSNPDNGVKIGITLPLTGAMASYGEEIKKGLDLAVEEINANPENKSKIELIYEDACYPKDATTAISKLVEIDEIDFVGGNFCVIAMPPISAVTEPKKISVMQISTASDMILTSGEYVFSPNIASAYSAKAQAKFAKDYWDANTVGIIHYNTDMGKSYGKNFAKEFENLGGKVLVLEETALEQYDFKDVLTKILEKNPDVLQLVHMGPNLGSMLNQLKSMGINKPIITYEEAENPDLFKTAKENAIGMVIAIPGMTESEYMFEFEKKFKDKYNENPAVLARVAYDAIHLEYAAYKNCGDNKDCIHDYLLNVKDYVGASGIYSILSDGTAGKEIVFKQVVDELGTLETIDYVPK